MMKPPSCASCGKRVASSNGSGWDDQHSWQRDWTQVIQSALCHWQQLKQQPCSESDHIVSNSLQPLVTRGCPASREAVEQFLIALRATSAALAVPRSCPASHLSHQHRFHRVHRPRAHQISTSRTSLTSLTSNDRHLAMNCFQFRFQLAITFCFSVASKPLY